MIAEQSKPVRLDILRIHDEDEMPSLLNPMTGQILITNQVGKRVIELADGQRTVAEIVSELSRQFKGAAQARMTADIHVFLGDCADNGLINWIH